MAAFFATDDGRVRVEVDGVTEWWTWDSSTRRYVRDDAKATTNQPAVAGSEAKTR